MNETRPAAAPDSVTQPWWDATRSGRLLVQRCATCGSHQHYPRSICTTCGSTNLTHVETAGRGTVYSYTIVRRAPHPFFEPPYVVALVRLDEGPVLLTNIVGCAREDVRCDMPVVVRWDDLPDGRRLPVFAPEEG
jgi:hypothetical protein